MTAKKRDPQAETEFAPAAAKKRPHPSPTDPPSAKRALMLWPYSDASENQTRSAR